MILGDGPLNGVAAVRAASMLARTARVPATCGELPDAASQIVACFDGPFTTAYGDLVASDRHRSASTAAGSNGTSSPIPYLDPPAGPRLALLMLRDAVPEPLTPEAAESQALTEAVVGSAREAGVRVSR